MMNMADIKKLPDRELMEKVLLQRGWEPEKQTDWMREAGLQFWKDPEGQSMMFDRLWALDMDDMQQAYLEAPEGLQWALCRALIDTCGADNAASEEPSKWDPKPWPLIVATVRQRAEVYLWVMQSKKPSKSKD